MFLPSRMWYKSAPWTDGDPVERRLLVSVLVTFLLLCQNTMTKATQRKTEFIGVY